MKLTKETIKKIQEDKALFIDIQKLLNTTEGTMYRYLRDNKPRLIGIDVLNVISARTGEDISQLTTSK
jgi:hypothetical protein